MTTSTNRKSTGGHFEEEIADLYKAMGYEVKQHVPLCGQEIDILASRNIPGGGNFNLIVECKYKGGNALAGNADVQSIAGAYNIAKANNLVSACTLVTSNGFSLSAQEAARAAGIHLATRHKLLKGLIDFEPYLRRLKEQYLNDFSAGGDSHYIDAKARRKEEIFESIDEYVDDWITQSNKSPLAILGGYGTGKTSFCHHYAVRLIDNHQDLVPVILPLRNLQKAIRLESLIRDFLDEECNASSPRFDSFWRMYSEGLLLIFFDGFDEMAVRVDSTVIEANLIEIERFAQKNANIILTCRPEFFITPNEERFAFDPAEDPLSDRKALYQTIELDLWKPEQVAQYVGKRIRSMHHHPEQPPEFYLERIKQLPELHDMSARAVHLDLIVKLLPSMIEKGIPLTRTNLYETYIKREFRRETIQNKRLQLMSDDSRLTLMRRITAESFFESNYDLTFESAARIIKQDLGIPSSEVEHFTRDFLNRSFLKREGDTYTFAHKSIGEYLFAVEVYELIRKGDRSFLATTNITSAVAGMMFDFYGFNAFDEMLMALDLDQSNPTVNADNLVNIKWVGFALAEYIRTYQSLFQQFADEKKVGPNSKAYLGLLHDTNNCVAALISRAQLLERKTPPEPDAKSLEILSDIWKTFLDRIQLLQNFEVDRLIMNVTLAKTQIDIPTLVKEVVAFIPEEKVNVQGSCGLVSGNKDFIQRVFENITINAAYAIRERGSLLVNISDDKGNGVRITFTNTGPRIPDELLGKIFDYGFSTKPNGTGIGLYIVKDLLDLHKGTVGVTSTEQKTEFNILLPKL